ncbi:MAG: anhydro-N-acetylmuramic acid kinase [Acidobacteria bacterium]|nr:anhydro-N-acetylmuramic acid kinase [Acidobacteriota bacterium]
MSKCIGLMSGTSLDGIDAALVEIEKNGEQIRFIGGITVPFPDVVKNELIKLAYRNTVDKEVLVRMDCLLGHLFSDAVEALLKTSGAEKQDILLIASHGQTIGHYPAQKKQLGHSTAFSFQIGDGDVIAARTGIPVVSDFRRRDMAAGGTGAPLIPLLDSLLFQNGSRNVCCLNIGGIANITVLTAGNGRIVAFDTGPGNCLSDLAVSRLVDGRMCFDKGGEMAFRGKVHDDILERVLDDPYFLKLPPKSTGREYFNEDFLDFILGLGRDISFEDMLATVSCVTPASIAAALRNFVPEDEFPEELIVSGGGVRNRFFMEKLEDFLPEMVVVSSEKYGVDPDFKEAMGFALMGFRTFSGLPSSIPSVTGADSEQILGKVSLTGNGSRFFNRTT